MILFMKNLEIFINSKFPNVLNKLQITRDILYFIYRTPLFILAAWVLLDHVYLRKRRAEQSSSSLP